MLAYQGNLPGKHYLLGSFYAGFYLYDGEKLSRFPTQIDEFLRDGTQHYKCMIMQDGNYALSIWGGGIVIINPQGEIIKKITTDQGLPSAFVTAPTWILLEDSPIVDVFTNNLPATQIIPYNEIKNRTHYLLYHKT